MSQLQEKPCEDVKQLNRELIMEAQEKMLTIPEEDKLELPVQNHFAKDIYGRELFMPAGSMIMGKIHKHSSLNILAQGTIILVTEDGRREISAPYTVASQPGIKRMIYALTDATWITVHGTDETDVEKIEEKFIAKDYSEVEYLDGGEEQKCLG